MTEQELKDAITSACEADYKHAMAAPKHHLFKDISKENKSAAATGHGKTYDTGTLSGAWQTACHYGCGSTYIDSRNNRNGQRLFPESARKIYSDRVYRPCATESGRTGESGNGGNRGQREEHNGDWC